MAQHTRTGVRRYENQAQWWRQELASASSPAEQFEVAHRWLRALARRARRQDYDDPAGIHSQAAADAYHKAAQAVAGICVELEHRNAPGPVSYSYTRSPS